MHCYCPPVLIYHHIFTLNTPALFTLLPPLWTVLNTAAQRDPCKTFKASNDSPAQNLAMVPISIRAKARVHRGAQKDDTCFLIL